MNENICVYICSCDSYFLLDGSVLLVVLMRPLNYLFSEEQNVHLFKYCIRLNLGELRSTIYDQQFRIDQQYFLLNSQSTVKSTAIPLKLQMLMPSKYHLW